MKPKEAKTFEGSEDLLINHTLDLYLKSLKTTLTKNEATELAEYIEHKIIEIKEFKNGKKKLIIPEHQLSFSDRLKGLSKKTLKKVIQVMQGLSNVAINNKNHSENQKEVVEKPKEEPSAEQNIKILEKKQVEKRVLDGSVQISVNGQSTSSIETVLQKAKSPNQPLESRLFENKEITNETKTHN